MTSKINQSTRELDITYGFYKIPITFVSDKKKKMITKYGHLCIAVPTFMGSKSKNFKFGVSFKAPNDKPDFNLGCKIAAGKLACDRPGRTFSAPWPKNWTPESDWGKNADLLERMLTNAFQALLKQERRVYSHGIATTSKVIPQWMQTAIEEGGKPSLIQQVSGKRMVFKFKVRPTLSLVSNAKLLSKMGNAPMKKTPKESQAESEAVSDAEWRRINKKSMTKKVDLPILKKTRSKKVVKRATRLA